MTKMVKKIAAMGAAVMMMASISCFTIQRAEIHLTQVAATAIQEALAQPAPHLPAERLKVRQ